MHGAPTTGERIVSALTRPNPATVFTDDGVGSTVSLAHPAGDGTIAVIVPPGQALRPIDLGPGPGIAVTLQTVDRAGTAAPGRAVVSVLGLLSSDRRALPAAPGGQDPLTMCRHAASALYRLRPVEAVWADAHGTEAVDARVLATIDPDPFSLSEASWLHRLEHSHAAVLASVTDRLPAALRAYRARPAGLDRYGLVLRLESAPDQPAPAQSEVRIPFRAPVDSPRALARELAALSGAGPR